MKTRIHYSSLTVILCLVVSAVQAQFTYDDFRDNVYQSVSTIYPGDPSIFGEGYVISSTTVDPSGSDVRGKVIRIDAVGNPLWTFIYTPFNGLNHRITHIEKVTWTGMVEYLVIGSVDYGGNSSLTVTLIDDNGVVINSNEFFPSTYPYLTGIKGIYSTVFNEYVIVGVESTGFTTIDQKDILVMGLDPGLNISWEYELSTPNQVYDYDFVTDVIETTPGEFAIVGTSNENSLATQSEPAAMVAVVSPGGLNWDYNFATTPPGSGHSDNAASAIFDQTTNSIWVLGNSSAQHYFHLTEFDPGGVLLNAYDFFDPDFDRYGFELKQSVQNPDHLIISGYKYTFNSSPLDEAFPILVEFDKAAIAVNWHYMYTTSNPGIASYAENNMLFMRALGQFGFFYNTIMDYRFDEDGYVFLGNDVLISGQYGIKFWGVDIAGNLPNPDCGIKPFPTNVTFGNRFQVDPLFDVFSPVDPTGPFVFEEPFDLVFEPCGPILKKGDQQEDIADASESITQGIYPNPASDILNISGYEEATHILIHDLSGKLVVNEQLDNPVQTSLPINQLNAGTYMVKVMKGEQPLTIEKLQVIK